MNIVTADQGTEEWFVARTGCCTASRMGDATNFKKGGYSSQKRLDYITELVVEQLTGQPAAHYVSKAMERGTEMEPFALAAYEMATGRMLTRVGFVLHDQIPDFGCSPDSLVLGDEDGSVEAKCPETSTHIEWIRAGIVPPEHVPQMVSVMSCTGAKWCDFISYDDRLPIRYQLFIRRLWREAEAVAAVESAAVVLLDEVRETIKVLNELMPEPEKPAEAEAAEWEKALFLTDEDFEGLYDANA